MPIPIDLAFIDVNGRPQVLHAATAERHGWSVQASLDGRAFARHCSDWQHVEHTREWLRAHAHESALTIGRPATAKWAVAAGLAAVLLLVSVATSQAQVSLDGNQAVLQFQRAADDYAFMHRRLERRLGPHEVTASSETVRIAMDAMAAAIRAARPDAQQGDVFTPAVQDAVRVRIAIALRAHDHTAAEALAAGVDAGARGTTFRVNGPFLWALEAPVLPCLIESLPKLPPELQYRLVGRDLLLIDVHARLIVDILPFAIANNGS